MNSQNTDSSASALPPPDTRRRAPDLFIGLFLFAAILCFAGAWMWLKSEPLWRPAQRFSVVFRDVAGLNVNGAVYMDGVRIGAVEKIILKGKRQVLVGLKINQENIRITEGALFDIRTNGLVGAKYVEVTLPDDTTDSPLLTPDTVAIGNDPMRTEMVVEHLAHQLQNVDLQTIEHRLNHCLDQTSVAAEEVSAISRKLHPAVERATVVEDRVIALASEARGTSRRINQMLDRNPTIGKDLKETARTAKEAAERFGQTVDKVQAVLTDETVRQDIVVTSTNLNDATENVRGTVDTLDRMSSNVELRNDLKHIVGNAYSTVDKVESLVKDPATGAKLKGTFSCARSALIGINTAAARLNSILSKRAPLLHLLFGRPGKLECEQTAGESTVH